MRISFSLPSNSSSKPNPIKPSTSFEDDDDTTNPNNLNDDASKQYIHEFTAAEEPSAKPRVIPPIPNEWQPGKNTMNSLEFVAESLSIDGSNSEIPYGLNLRQRPESEEAVVQKLKEELKVLPEIRGMEEFDENPVEGFGAALLAGYGWQPGRGIGKNAKEDVGVVEVRPNVGRQGLGFRPE
ncbi:protein MOS2 [Rosa sericea]